LTLIEVIVSVAILAIIGGVVATAFAVGLKVVAPGGAQSRLANAHDFMVLEQQLGKDAARASCIQVQGDSMVYGQSGATCRTTGTTTGYGKVTDCSAAALCFGWPVLGSQADFSDYACNVAVYMTAASIVTRGEYSVRLGATTWSGAPVKPVMNPLTAKGSTVDFQVPPAAGTLDWANGPTGSYKWIRTLPVKLVATGVSQGQFSQTLTLHPVATDPGGAGAVITSQGSPC
jgi:hypothetical protein